MIRHTHNLRKDAFKADYGETISKYKLSQVGIPVDEFEKGDFYEVSKFETWNDGDKCWGTSDYFATSFPELLVFESENYSDRENIVEFKIKKIRKPILKIKQKETLK